MAWWPACYYSVSSLYSAESSPERTVSSLCSVMTSPGYSFAVSTAVPAVLRWLEPQHQTGTAGGILYIHNTGWGGELCNIFYLEGLLIILILYIVKLKLSGFGNEKIISWTTIQPASRRKVSTHADGGPRSPTVNAWTFTRPPIPSEVISEVSESKFSCHIRWFYALSFCLKKI